MITLIVVNVLIFVVLPFVNMLSTDGGMEIVGRLVLNSDPAIVIERPWTVLTYSFVNASFLQLLLNMLCLFYFGRVFSSGASLLVAVYFVGAISGALFYLVLNRYFDSAVGTMLVGSSSAVIAVMAADGAIVPDIKLLLPLVGRVKMKVLVVMAIVLFSIGLSANNAGGNLAHLGGAVAGLICGLMVNYQNRRKTDIMEYQSLVAKVKKDGYDSLSASEKQQFFKLSSKCK